MIGDVMKKSITVGTLFLCFISYMLCPSSYAEDELLQVNNKYRTRVNLNVSLDKSCWDDANKKDEDCVDKKDKGDIIKKEKICPESWVGMGSKFVVLSNSEDKYYSIKFLNSYDPKNNDNETDHVDGKIYYLKKEDDKNVSINNRVEQSLGGMASGPMIVPFKYRLDDKTLDGSISIGYYVGWGWDTNFGGISESYATITPFLAGGWVPVVKPTVDKDGQETDKGQSGYTWAVGLLVKNWHDTTFGFVYGEDRLGDSDWEHEGEGWFSMSVGWKF